MNIEKSKLSLPELAAHRKWASLALPEREEKILKFWEENKIFEKSLEKTKRGKTFVFYEGPPTANAAPGIHHVLARAFKDIIPRYKTMRGFFVPRKAGWDTHGLPVEIQIEKELGFKTKQDIEKYGIAKFNQKAKESVWRYKEEWEKLTKRIGYWLDLEHPYITYDIRYMETLWWVIKEIWKKGLLVEDFKVVPWCPRCQTGLSTHELGQPGAYRLVKDNSIYVKLKIKGRKNEYLLVWTTTPWTLPANVAVAVNPKIDYTKFKIDDEFLWSAVMPPYGKDQKITIIEKASGKSLIGINYEPLFRVPQGYSWGKEPEFVTIPADFVSTEEGTGMVHIAPAFGDEDMLAAKKTWGASYPILHTVNVNGKMKKGVIGEGKFVKDADEEITADLKRRKLLYRLAPYEHEYPHCWRCDTPLLYFAQNAWWIRTTAVKDKLLKENEKINWIPEHLKHGRFGDFLRELRDWAFSRERYWGTPLPIWKCTGCKKQEVIGSREELSLRVGKAKNRYFAMRHGESLANVRHVFDSHDSKFPITLRGRSAVEKSAKTLKQKKIDFIFSSEILRARETAEIVARALGHKEIKFDRRLNEIDPGVFEGRSPAEYHKFYTSTLEKWIKPPPRGESLGDVRARATALLEDLEKKYIGKNILLVSHDYPIWALYAGAVGFSDEEAVLFRKQRRGQGEEFVDFAETMEVPYKILPRDDTGSVNLHRPYVDSFEFPCHKCKSSMRRVLEVVDVWFDSGAMPFAQSHWPFANNQQPKKLLYPADYIAEAVDQTRGWFYTLLAVATLLGKGAPYKNVISLGHVLDKNGQKMSKSKGNVVDPWEMIEKYGADAVRWYFYTVNAPGEPKRFDEKDLQAKLRGFLMTLWNSFVLFDTYIEKITNSSPRSSSGGAGKTQNLLDRWVLTKVEILIKEVTAKLERYDIAGAGRDLEDFVINDFSQWYLRRSRRRFQHPQSKKEFEGAAQTTATALLSLVKLIAPFVPFLSEAIYQELKKKMSLKELSVHLTPWPDKEQRTRGKEQKLLDDMEAVRTIVAEALKLRAVAGIKVRQPLGILQIANRKLSKELLGLIKDEVNVKDIVLGRVLKLDTALTPELKEEGLAREFIRNIQEMRKDLGLKPKQVIRGQITGDRATEDTMVKWQQMIKKETNMRELKVGGKKEFKIERELDFDGKSLWLGIKV
ncbi:MAG: class I tRNA ligase family protein [Candidatus Sungiibacteriota bacterium]|uniref:Isoleucine--tRNA ligase n=1 Tax=Candidatus Sungiibacteriota bacterium TaxID=2750080 RepID=A0A7T5RIT7_9BACT|nr:MAG: class I tRNA ligase family protein [Candidatus Sungbacteria bacterium]